MSAPFLSPGPTAKVAMPWLADIRGRARDNYGKLGLPSPRVEDWRYTRLSHLTDDAFGAADLAPPLSIDDLRAIVPNLGAAQAVLVNGVFRPELSTVGALPDGVQVASLGRVLTDAPDLIRLHLGRLATLPDRPLTSLNTAHLGDGLVVHLKAGSHCKNRCTWYLWA